MYDKLYAIDTSKSTNKQTLQFLQNFARLIYSGAGGRPKLSVCVDMLESDGLRVLLGVPESWLTDPRQRLIESVWAYTLGLPFRPHPEIWTDQAVWCVTNPRVSAEYPLDSGTTLDADFIASFGLRTGVWEDQVLQSPGIIAKIKRNDISDDMLFRCFMALASFGFREPHHFFTRRL